ncbi:MAG: hypothetical protein OXR73_36715 [Myxococcales bacterium]|nr:hypothetical protein [Myxococcales bacterium]
MRYHCRVRLAYCVTAHGLGHWTRSAALIDALLRLDPSLDIVVSTGLPESVVRSELGARVRYRAACYEPGACQTNCFDIDLDSTVNAYLEFEADRAQLLAHEREFLSSERIELVVSDVAALPVMAAGSAGVPAVAVANFTWDWVLGPLLQSTRAEHLPQTFAQDYGRGSAHFLLPFGQLESPFDVVVEAPVVARTARHTRSQTRTALSIEGTAARPVILVCIGGWRGSDLPPIEPRGAEHVLLLVVGDLTLRSRGPTLHLPHVLPQSLTFPDLVQLADGIITKPGYGMASEAYVHGTPIAFVEREGFRETPAIFQALRSRNRHPHRIMSRTSFATGDWGPTIDALVSEGRAAPQAEGSETVARELLRLAPHCRDPSSVSTRLRHQSRRSGP